MKGLTPRRRELQVKNRSWLAGLGFGDGLGRFFGRLGEEFHFAFFEEAVAAAGDAFDRERTEADAHDFFDGMVLAKEGAAEGLEFGALHLHLVPIILAAGAGGFGLTDGLEFDADFLAEALEVVEGKHAFYLDVVSLLEMIPVFEELGGEIAVVGHEDQAGGGVFEIADGIDALWKTAKEIAEGFAAFGIGERGDDFGRFVEEKIHAAGSGFDGAAGGFDFILGGIGFGAELGDSLAVDANLAGEDELFGMAAGGDAGTGDDFLEAFEHGGRITEVALRLRSAETNGEKVEGLGGATRRAGERV